MHDEENNTISENKEREEIKELVEKYIKGIKEVKQKKELYELIIAICEKLSRRVKDRKNYNFENGKFFLKLNEELLKKREELKTTTQVEEKAWNEPSAAA